MRDFPLTRPPRNPRLWKVLEKLEELPAKDQKVVLRTIDALAKDAKGA